MTLDLSNEEAILPARNGGDGRQQERVALTVLRACDPTSVDRNFAHSDIEDHSLEDEGLDPNPRNKRTVPLRGVCHERTV
jgi:hypothetical protein